MRTSGHQESMLTIHDETIPLAAVSVTQNWTITKVTTMTHVIMKTLVNTEITETPLNRISESIATFSGNESENVNVLRLTAADGARPIHAGPYPLLPLLHHLTASQGKRNDVCTGTRLREAEAVAPYLLVPSLKSLKSLRWIIKLRIWTEKWSSPRPTA